MTKVFGIFILFIYSLFSCQSDKAPQIPKTKNVIILVIDGPRITETWNDPTRQNIPKQASLLSEGVLMNNFRNEGLTKTFSGHCAITTGNYIELNNSGMELPPNPSIFQLLRKQYNLPAEKTWLVGSKDKIEALGNCEDPLWLNKYQPSTNCGINGGGLLSGYRDDSSSFVLFLDKLTEHHPRLALLNFREPDYSGHSLDSNAYLQGIRDTDEYAYKMWQFIQSDPQYRDNTTLIITNDHGRHLDGVSGGFGGHGDDCEGCRHISLLGFGPDFKQNVTIENQYNQIDLSATIAYLLGISMPEGQGKVIKELLR